MEKHKIKLAIDTTYMDRRSAKGTAIVIRHTVEELVSRKDDFDITLIHREHIPEDPLYKEFKEIVIKKIRSPKYSNFFSELWFFLTTKEKFDVYYFSYSKLFPTFWLAPAKKIVFAAMDGGPQTAGYFNPKTKGKQPKSVRLFFRFVDAFIAITEFGKKGIVSTYGIPEQKVHVVYNGVEEKFVPATTTTREEISFFLKQKYGFPETYILNVSRFDPHKNIIRCLDAFKKLVTEGVNEHLVFVGGRHMPDYSLEIEKHIQKLGLQDRIFIAPYIDGEDMPLVYQAASMLVFPSLYEGFGLPVIEVMACGRPVVISNIDALKEVSNNLAEIVDPYSVDSIADGMRRAFVIDKKRIDEGIVWARHFTWAAHIESLIGVFKSVYQEAKK